MSFFILTSVLFVEGVHLLRESHTEYAAGCTATMCLFALRSINFFLTNLHSTKEADCRELYTDAKMSSLTSLNICKR